MAYVSIMYEQRDGVAKITLNNPKNMNAMEQAVLDELAIATKEIANDEEVKAVIITGTDRAFCAGGDLNRFIQGFTLISGLEHMNMVHPWVLDWINLNKPTIAAVNGHAAGAGLSLALMCDICICSEKAKFSSAFISMGLIPDLASAYYLPRAIGTQRAKEMMYTGRQVDSGEAFELGLVNRVVPHDKLEEETFALAGKLATGASFALRNTKQIINMSLDLDLKAFLTMEASLQGMCLASEDSAEAVSAFLAKRKPVFKGK